MAVPLARYGRGELIAATVGLLACSAAFATIFPPAIPLPLSALAFVFYGFRDPERVVPADPAAVVAPADGTVADIGDCDEARFFGGRALRIGIFLSLFDVHVNRAPVAGRVAYLDYRRGRFLNALRRACARENENHSIGLVADAVPGGRVLVRQIAGAIAQRIVCDCRIDERLERGQRIGMIKFGSRTELYLPCGSALELRVKVGDHVRGGESVLAVLRAGTPTSASKEIPVSSDL